MPARRPILIAVAAAGEEVLERRAISFSTRISVFTSRPPSVCVSAPAIFETQYGGLSVGLPLK